MKPRADFLVAMVLACAISCATSTTNEGASPPSMNDNPPGAPDQTEAGAVMTQSPDAAAPMNMTKTAWGSVVSVGPFASCVIDENSDVHCFGRCGPTAQGGSRNMAPAGLKARSVAVGNTFACALLTEPQDGTAVRCWGDEAVGTAPKLTDAVELAAGGNHACARNEKGSVTCWGAAPADGGAGHAPPTDLVAAQLALSDAMDCAIAGDASVRCWGPRPVTPPSELRAKRIAVSTQLADPVGGPRYGCAVTADGSVRCWGDDPGGVQTVPQALQAKDIAVGRSAACAIALDGSIVCWGTSPRFGAPAPQGRKATAISMSFRSIGAVLEDRSFTFWGDVGDGRGAAPAGVRAP
jgi:hypothetical protein